MSRKFVTDREINFINAINHELIQAVVGQTVFYYAISIPETRVNDLYKEAVEKTWCPPVEINALVRYDSPVVVSTQFGPDTDYNLDVYFHLQELQERNVSPKEGDFLEFGQIFFEITSATEPQIIFGQINNKMMVKCTCVKSREEQFKAGGQSDRNIAHDHQIQQSLYEPK